MSNNYSKQLSTDQITQKLTNLNYSCDEQCWNDFQQQHQGSRINSVNIPTKFNPKFLAIPIGLIVITSIIYFSINSLRSENSAKKSIVQPVESKSKPDISEKSVENKTPKQIIVAPLKKNTVKEIIKIKEEPKKPIIENIAKVKKEKDSSEIKQNETAKIQSPPVVNDPPQKTKKKRKKRSSSYENSTNIPSPEEDNVVIPEN